MKVLAINSSARKGGQSKTEWMLEHLVEGMAAARQMVRPCSRRKNIQWKATLNCL